TAIYFRAIGQKGSASRSLSPIKSIPVDRVYFDERDEMDDARVDEAEHRLDGSLCPELTSFSTPTLPDYGVDYEYKQSDQRSWLWKCEACNAWTCLEDTYPDCIAEPRNADPYYLCSGCRNELRRFFKGEWVARRPEVKDHRGYWVSQLCSPTKTALDIVAESVLATKRGRMRAFYNQTLGRAFAEVEDQITVQQLEACLREETRPLNHEGPCAMGVDPGKPHWYEVRVRLTDTDSQQVARGRVDSYEELSAIAKRFNVESGVMDQGYDPSAVARFVDAHPGWYGGLYVGSKKTDHDWDHAEKVVKMGRTRLLDDAHHEIIAKRVSFYARDEFWHEQFVPQMTNLKRATIENRVNGQRDAAWVVTGGKKNDHLRHASAYAMLACSRVGLSKSVVRANNRASASSHAPRRPNSAMVM
ncbi:MAG: phage terminase large subunit family protein, partial [Kofleriaceae bacterium]|nr:phage terminase large subunit family protein [Kofleriaceae bacterium]